ncbi:hypothetical protein [Carboxylicivirga sp. RSCT41]|uniref:hypothetical protein n=1 Tax=Carboxylicivirga agarovorans TaxID=3417570 RepID=UPI003D34FFF0
MKNKPNKTVIATIALLVSLTILSALIHPYLFVSVAFLSVIIGEIVIDVNKKKEEKSTLNNYEE